ncbi:MAG TPA: histidine kinase dimerization/phosphoacceptor domain -containing protein [Puia sp.]|uniref:histidine kinase dimerization/phosphoacceptor domain -containing protein n=1 Tax=Puia sp. TaxID=2045100 RepID=UPI002C80EDE6|nr:histidine kinase dimerization/phosphoacceptor domain -containing protein [Puia sp.]HVU98485.1 histidine kinase dimerization/phosphoacceptor domain -containing protein [Puia sp.]
MNRVVTFIILLLLLTYASTAQFAPWPDPVNPGKEQQLLRQLSTDTGVARIQALTNLANIYTYRTFKAPDDTQRANKYLRLAEEACKPGYPQPLYNAVQLLKGNMLLEQDRFDLAAQIPVRVDDTTKAKLCIVIGKAWIDREDGNDMVNGRTALSWLGKAAALVDSAHDPILYNVIEQNRAYILVRKGNYAEAEARYNKVLAAWQKMHYPRPQSTYLQLGDLYWIVGDYDKSLAATLKALDFSLATHDSTTLGDIHTFLANIFRNTGQLQKTVDNLNAAIGVYKVYAGHFGTLFYCIHQVGHVFVGKKQYREALAYFLDQYHRYPPQNADDRRTVTADIGDCYLKLKDYPRAEQYFHQEFDDRRKAGKLAEGAWHRLAFFYVESGQFRRALPLLDSAVDRLDPLVSLQTRGHLYYMHFLADSAVGNYLSAIHYLRANRQVDADLTDKSKLAELQRLTVQYETDGKNKQIDLLQKTNQLYLANQHNAVLVRNISIGAILLLGLVAWIFYFQFRNKKRLAALVNEKNKQLGVLLNEKEWLLKEVHHRVKNNLHTVISLLDIQAEFLRDDALKAIENSQHRIYAMSLIHQKLYAGDSLTTINVAAYIGELVGYLRDSFEDGSDLRFQVDVEPLDLDIAIAIPLGLIINEAVSNSCKYAFHGKKRNRLIGITLSRLGDGIQLECRDNGIGLSAGAFDTRPGSLGLTLIKGLGKEINAEVEIANDNGTRIRIHVPTFGKVDNNLN